MTGKKFFIIVLLIIPNLAWATTQSDWQEYIQHGHKNPKWDGYVEAGFSAFDSGNMGPAEMFLQRSIARGCEDGLVYLKIGLYYEMLKNYKKAVSFLQKAYKKLPLQYPNHEVTKSINEYLGRVLFLNAKHDEAIQYLEKSLSSNENYTALYFLGQIYKSKKQIQKAIDHFERALKAGRPEGLPVPVDILIMTELGKAYYELKNFDEASKWWDLILSIDPNNATAKSYKTEMEQTKLKEEERKIIEEIIR